MLAQAQSVAQWWAEKGVDMNHPPTMIATVILLGVMVLGFFGLFACLVSKQK